MKTFGSFKTADGTVRNVLRAFRIEAITSSNENDEFVLVGDNFIVIAGNDVDDHEVWFLDCHSFTAKLVGTLATDKFKSYFYAPKLSLRIPGPMEWHAAPFDGHRFTGLRYAENLNVEIAFQVVEYVV